MILGYLVVTSVLIVSLGRLGDMYGRVRIYNLGFVIYTVASLLLAIDWMTGRAGATVPDRLPHRAGRSAAPACSPTRRRSSPTRSRANQRGMALGINNIVGVSGMFIGLVLGGVLAPIDWRLVFLISVPVGLFGTVWAYRSLRELQHAAAGADRLVGQRDVRARAGPGDGRGDLRHPALRRARRRAGAARACSRCWPARVTRSSRSSVDRAPRRATRCSACRCSGSARSRSARCRRSSSAVARGGLMFMLIIWLQGIWLPQHGYDFTETPLWAGIYMLPLTVGMLIAGPDLGLPLRPLRRAPVRDRRDAR